MTNSLLRRCSDFLQSSLRRRGKIRRHYRLSLSVLSCFLLITYYPNPAQHLRPSGVLSCWPDGLELINGLHRSGIPRAAQAAFSIYLKRTCSRVTSASSALELLNDYAMRYTHSLTHSLTVQSRRVGGVYSALTAATPKQGRRVTVKGYVGVIA